METTKNSLWSTMLNISLWLAQIALATMFFMVGQMKAFSSMDQLNMLMPWTKDVPHWLTRFIGVAEILGSIGLLLPAALKIKPILTPLAAVGVGLIMVLAILFHIYRGEAQIIGMHFAILAVAIFVIWGRVKKMPIQSKK